MPKYNEAENGNVVQQCQKIFWILLFFIPSHWQVIIFKWMETEKTKAANLIGVLTFSTENPATQP